MSWMDEILTVPLRPGVALVRSTTTRRDLIAAFAIDGASAIARKLWRDREFSRPPGSRYSDRPHRFPAASRS